MTAQLGPLSRTATGSDRGEGKEFRLDSVTALLGAALLVIIVSVVCIAFLSSTNDFMEGNNLWNGLADLAVQPSVKMVDDIAGAVANPTAKTLITVPQVPHADAEVAAMTAFVNGGGQLVVLSDDSAGNRLAAALGLPARFRSELLLDPLFCFKNPAFPRITDFSPDLVAAGVRSVVLNNGTVLSVDDDAAVIAWSSPESYLSSTTYGPDGKPLAHGPFAIAARYKVGQGEVVLMADASLIVNSMQKVEDNRLFLDSLLPPDPQPGSVLIDRAHLEKAPMDEAKRSLSRAQAAFSQPQYSLPVLLLVFIVGAQYFVRRRKDDKPNRE